MRRARWTWLIYMAADTGGDLYRPTEAILKEMTRAASSPQINVVVERILLTGSVRMQIRHGERKVLEKLPLVNSGQPKYLTDFLNWGVEEFPADHTAAVIFGHGTGVNDAPDVQPQDRKRKRASLHTDAIAITNTFRDYLTTWRLRKAFVDAKKKFDLIGLDACQMGMVEIAYELRNTTPLLLASQYYLDAWRWPYGAIVQKLAEQPTMSPGMLANAILDAFDQESDGDRQNLATISLKRIAPVVRGFAELSDELRRMVGARPGLRVLKKVQASTSQFESGFLDAEDLVRRLQASGVNVGHLQKALDSAVVRVVDKPDGTSGQAAGGLSVFFPAQGDSSDEEVARYDRLDFSKQTGWGKFISLWLAATSAVTDSRFIEAPSGHGRAAPAHIA